MLLLLLMMMMMMMMMMMKEVGTRSGKEGRMKKEERRRIG